MAVTSIQPNYSGPFRDRVENFHGNQLVYVHWEGHLNFCSAIALALRPEMPFRTLAEEVIAGLYGSDPQWASVDLSRARWMLDGVDWNPVPERPIGEQQVGHKSLIRFWTDPVENTRG